MIVRADASTIVAMHAFAGTSRHGVMEGGACVVLAMGKLGSREMNAGSDLDLILIYDVDPARARKHRPPCRSTPRRYYTRLTQRLIAALTVATRRGRLYEVDMRLRPSGVARGRLRRRLSFLRPLPGGGGGDVGAPCAHPRQGHRRRSWPWPMRVTAAIDTALRTGPDSDAVACARRRRRHACAHRAGERGTCDVWDLKLARGGLLDIEFIAQATGAAACGGMQCRTLRVHLDGGNPR